MVAEKSENQKYFESNNNNMAGARIGASNSMIDAAIRAYQKDPCEAAREYVYETIRVRISHGAQFLVPTPDGSGFGRIRNPQNGTDAFIAFTSYDGRESSCSDTFVSYDMKHFLEMVLLSGADGICVNPGAENAFSGEDGSGTQTYGFGIDKEGIFRILRSDYNVKYRMDFVKEDITKMKVDAIVNAADAALSGSSGLDAAVHAAAGSEMQEACAKIGECGIGDIEVTDGFLLPAKYVFHTVGPEFSGTSRCAALLASCYRMALMAAGQLRVHSIAFPAISTGASGYPKREAARVAYRAVKEWLERNESYPLRVLFVCYDDETLGYYRELSGENEGLKMKF